jgi:hypothetical protein
MASRWDGKILGQDSVSEGPTFSFSPNGRYVTALQGFTGDRAPVLWVIDVRTAKVVKRKQMPKNAGEALGWIDNSTIGMGLLMNEELTPILRVHGRQPRTKIPVYGRG